MNTIPSDIRSIVNSIDGAQWSIASVSKELSVRKNPASMMYIKRQLQNLCSLGDIKKVQADRGTPVHYEGCYREPNKVIHIVEPAIPGPSFDRNAPLKNVPSSPFADWFGKWSWRVGVVIFAFWKVSELIAGAFSALSG